VLAALGVAVALLVLSDRRRDPGESYRFDTTRFQQADGVPVAFAETAKLETGLERVSALAVGPKGRFYVAGPATIAVYAPNGREAKRIEFDGTPNCLAVAPDGGILVGLRDHVEELDALGKAKSTWESFGDEAYLTSITVGEEDVFVADAGHRRVARLGRDGRLLGFLGEADPDREIPGLIVPSPNLDVAIDPQGALWVVNPGRHGLESYRADGTLASAWYRPSMAPDGFCGCCNPTHIAFRSDGTLVTAEKGIARVKLYSPDQALLAIVAAPETFDPAAGAPLAADLDPPIRDLAVDAEGRVLVLGSRDGVVRIFEETGGTP